MDKVSMSHLISFSGYQTKCVVKFLFRQLRRQIFLGSTFKAMADKEKKGMMKIQKFEYLEYEKSFSDEIKNIFHSFRRTIIWQKIKI